ncbi:voltage-gated potassium channel [Seinonella peptonophila]|uniref:Voltage-gated potassium channel n=1 Tax=Seinonella peptonophila TaxID=112248 RepID=A0A1M4XI68_9BACL|nr:potassium channel family protein [Seinonella peptonophila]SHE93199.1 voltage-gated potassium channel [Seinonella peptonophila]
MNGKLLKQLTQRRLVLFYEIFVIFLVLSYSILLIQNSSGAIPDILTPQEMLWLDWGLIFLFGLEYLVRYIYAAEKRKFVMKNWFELIAMLPLDSHFRFFRILRFIQLVRMSKILSAFFRRKELRYSFVIVSLVVLWGATGVYLIEAPMSKNIHSFLDAIWWAIVTTTTVGYGDISPVTLGGRMIAVVLMFTGIGLIGSVTASIATHFMEYLKIPQEITGEDRVRRDLIELIEKKLEEIEELSDEEYKTLLAMIETMRHQKVD